MTPLPTPRALLLAAGLTLPPLSLSAQAYATDKGVIVLGGSAEISRFRDIGNDAHTTLIDLNPKVGYFVLPGLLLAANLQYGHISAEDGSSSFYGVGPSLTYYLRHRATAINPYLAARTLYQHQGFHPDDFPDAESDSFSWLGSVGVAVFVARNVALTGEVFYTHTHVTVDVGAGDQSNSAETFGTQFGIAVHAF